MTEDTRSRLVEVAARLLAAEGPDAVTTRSVALAAGVQAPAIYRLFGDKNGLLEAVAEHGFASYVAQKPAVDAGDDPLDGLRAGWELHVGFGLANPALFRLMHTTARTPEGQATVDAGIAVLRRRVHRVARAGRLRVTEDRAVQLIHAAGTGVVFALITRPTTGNATPAPENAPPATGTGAHGGSDARAETLADLAWESVCATILTEPDATAPAATPAAPAVAAVTLRAALPELTALTPHERALLGDWLDRIATTGPTPGDRPVGAR